MTGIVGNDGGASANADQADRASHGASISVESPPFGDHPSRIANIANRLSGLERAALLHREGASEACMSWDTAYSLYDKGLTLRKARFLRLTWLGAKVREALQCAMETDQT